MPDFEDQRVFSEPLAKAGDVLAILGIILERPGKLKQKCTQATLLDQRSKSLLEEALVLRPSPSLVSTPLPEFGGELEFLAFHLTNPFPYHWGPRGMIERCVDFHRRKELGQVFEFMKALGCTPGIDHTAPVRVRPPCRTDANHRAGGN